METPISPPDGWAREVTMRTGAPALIRPIRPDDAPRLIDLFRKLSRESIYYRFFFKRKELGLAEAEHLARVDYTTRMAFVAELPPFEDYDDLIGVARYEPIEGKPEMVEMAIVVADDFQHHGLGRHLLHMLGDYALAQGYQTMLAEVLNDNYRMFAFLERSGYPQRAENEGTMRHVFLTLLPAADIADEEEEEQA